MEDIKDERKLKRTCTFESSRASFIGLFKPIYPTRHRSHTSHVYIPIPPSLPPQPPYIPSFNAASVNLCATSGSALLPLSFNTIPTKKPSILVFPAL